MVRFRLDCGRVNVVFNRAKPRVPSNERTIFGSLYKTIGRLRLS